jgi:hypothetical protein
VRVGFFCLVDHGIAEEYLDRCAVHDRELDGR